MTKEALKLALEALEECRRDPRLKYEHPYYDKTITAIREALAEQPAQQEPVAQEWRYYFSHSGATGKPDEVVGPCFTDRKEVAFGVGCFDQTALYPPAQRKPWVGLTDEEIKQAFYDFDDGRTQYIISFARAIEAKLREKNT